MSEKLYTIDPPICQFCNSWIDMLDLSIPVGFLTFKDGSGFAGWVHMKCAEARGYKDTRLTSKDTAMA